MASLNCSSLCSIKMVMSSANKDRSISPTPYDNPFNIGLFLSFSHNISLESMNIADDIGSPCLHPLFNLKCRDIRPPFIVDT